jgi:F0F1-type ATP synthase membrane subunit c/vacuolar-type H+-ATPase subunit K
MGHPVERKQLKSDLVMPWVIVSIMLTMLAANIIVCHVLGGALQQQLPETQRELFRTVFYVVAIMTFPLTNLIRHIQLRLNQTMPRSDKASRIYKCDDSEVIAEAKARYLVTIIVSMSLVEVVGIFGLVMFMWGDGFNTLYIFSGLSALGLFLYRPKTEEYIEIIEAISAQKSE